MARYEYGHFQQKWYNPLRFGLEGVALHGANLLADVIGIGSLTLLKTRRSAHNIAKEEMEMHVVTGKDPTLNPVEVAAIGGFELGLSLIDQGAAVTAALGSLGLAAPFVEALAFGADSLTDTAIGKLFERIHYRREVRAGLHMPAIDNATTFAGLFPVLPVTFSLSFLQWYGRAMERKEIRALAKGRV